MKTAVNPSEATRLARICAYSTEESEWVRFVRLVSPIVSVSARRIGASWGDASPGTTSEIVQEVFLKLCEDNRRILREFEDRGNDSFPKLLRMVTASVGTDYFRKLHAEKRGGRSLTASLDEHDLGRDLADKGSVSDLEWPALMSQLDKLLKQFPAEITERDRILFWLYYRQGFTADAISRIPDIGLGAKGVESALLRMSKFLRKCISRGNLSITGKTSPLADSQKTAGPEGFSPVVAIDSIKRP